MGSIPGSKDPLEQGRATLLQYSCLENPIDRGAWWATVHRVAKSQTRRGIDWHLVVLGLPCCVGFSLGTASWGYSLLPCVGFSVRWRVEEVPGHIRQAARSARPQDAFGATIPCLL